ncbi:MAG: hypothetical protein A2014_02115 [Spirochaetes bacterium GWF1_49_6]|nr:MAG: hypothetical protein A2014_02115 [Spirochaetes bacterium GWF1_49_6]
MKKSLLILFASIVLIGASCSLSETMQAEKPADGASLSELGYGEGSMVKLFYSHCFAIQTFGKGTFMGYIEIENAAYQKQVVVHYELDGVWSDLAASYVKSLGNNKELWYFTYTNIGFNPFGGWDINFAIKYVVNGQTYWDNNGGADYHVGAGPRNFYPDFAWSKSIAAMQNAQYNNIVDEPFFTGRVYTKYAEGDKSVKIVYTTDNWATVKECPAQYSYDDSDFTGGNKYSVWWYVVPIEGSPAEIKFAIAYTLNGSTAWDNNFGRNYTLVPVTIWE